MKRITFLLISVLTMTVINAQNITDGLRYSTDALNGTARFNALSGAFGALGGDLSAIEINPAGSAIFIFSTSSVSFSVNHKKNKASYFNTKTNASDTDLNFNQAGAVFVYKNPNQDSSWKKFTFAINYIATQNYDNELFIKGTGNTSIGEFFLVQAQGIPLDLLQLQNGESISGLYAFLGETEGTSAQNAFLGFQGYIFDPLDPDDITNTQYISNIASGNFNQEYIYLTSGYSGKYTFNFATQVSDKFFFGVNLNIHSIDYLQSTFLYETNSNPGSIINKVGFENNLAVYGTGFSTQVGAIAKLTDALRLGITYDSPTWYVISEETTQYLETQRTVKGELINEFIDPHIINIFQDYDLKTPQKISGSIAYVFGKQGFLSFDYTYKDYSQIKFSPSNDPAFALQNNLINSSLKGSSGYKLGGEYRINDLSLRGGYLYEESPYKDEVTVGNLNGFSLGLGYNLGVYNFDFSYSRTQQDRNQQLYSIGLTDTASIETIISNYVLTFGFSI